MGRKSRSEGEVVARILENTRAFLVMRFRADPEGRSIRVSEVKRMLHYHGQGPYAEIVLSELVKRGEVEIVTGATGKETIYFTGIARSYDAAE